MASSHPTTNLRIDKYSLQIIFVLYNERSCFKVMVHFFLNISIFSASNMSNFFKKITKKIIPKLLEGYSDKCTLFDEPQIHNALFFFFFLQKL